MSECLAEVREEAACRKKEAERLTADLKKARSEKAAEKPLDAPPAEPDGEVECERDVIEDTIAQAANADPDLFVAILMIDRLQMTTARFGAGVATKIAEYCARQTRASLRGARHVMVWKDNACVAFLDGTGGAGKVARNVSHEVQQRRSITLELSGREVILPVTYAKGLAFPIAGRTASSLVASMNAFLVQDAPVAHKTA